MMEHHMKSFLLLLFLFGSIASLPLPAILEAYNDTDAMTFEGLTGLNKTQEALSMLYTAENYVLIGAQNTLFNVSLDTMEATKRIAWIATDVQKDRCDRTSNTYPDCESHVRSIVMDQGEPLICGSSARQPDCRKIHINQTDNSPYLLMDQYATAANLPSGLAPVSTDQSVFTLRTAENTLYTLTKIFNYGSYRTILFRNGTVAQDGTPLLKLRNSPFAFTADGEITDEFKSLFEIDDSVYMTFTEPAIETFKLTDRKVYSRIARVCKEDRGLDNIFLMFYKARLLCGVPNNSKEYGAYYDELAATTVPHISSIRGSDGEEVIVAAFNTPKKGVFGSAVCAFRVSDIEQVFATSPILADAGRSTLDELPAQQPPLTKCSSNASSNLRDEEKLLREHTLLKNPVKAVNNKALFLDSGYRMTNVVVDWQVEALDGSRHDVIFVSTDDGRLLTLIDYGEGYKMIEQRQVFTEGTMIVEMKLVQDSYGKKHILLNSMSQIKRVSLEKCHRYTNCDSCVASHDPYCSWAFITNEGPRCVSTSHGAQDKIQSLQSGQSDRCLITTTIVWNMTTEEMATGDPNGEVTIIDLVTEEPVVEKGDTGALVDKEADGSKQNVLIALCVALPIVIGGLAFVLGWYFGARRNRSKTPHLDELAKNKEDTLKADHDVYQVPSKQINVNKGNLLYNMNNLNNSKMTNSTDELSIGETTLQRQKKVYV